MAVAANPHTLRMRVTTCPTGLQQWSEPAGMRYNQARGLATPNIDNLGHRMPKPEEMGRRRHLNEVSA